MKKPSITLPKILEVAGHTGSLCTQRVRCSKSGCRCARGQLHEGYYYFFWVTPSGKLAKRYVRREDVFTVQGVIDERRLREAIIRGELKQASAFLRDLVSKLEELL
jgi:hypothetical protein